MFRALPKSAALMLLSMAIPLAVLPAAVVHAGVPGSTSATNTDEHGLALRGYDPVAYFVLGKPTQGKAQISATYAGAHYLFVSEADRKLFVSDPGKYLPQFGGFCAVGTAYGKKVDTDPTTGVVVNGKLYLNYNAKASLLFKKDTPGIIQHAQDNWPEVKNQAL
ncbi:MAG TPA: YHS domain-containing (seleno)protein [Dyella sp.]|uniref:YHS domain-containing (seleno)protein n=1 Tax=Dyella sp. TaxID=1869338 RepID=UPI002BC951B2|nr:YHS domain-containing (seleno)protein [Dyella sp.]HTV85961.1 YHS domain-containing (seleno)protein [Dyella sp.]